MKRNSKSESLDFYLELQLPFPNNIINFDYIFSFSTFQHDKFMFGFRLANFHSQEPFPVLEWESGNLSGLGVCEEEPFY